jgi:hypothetical protein
VSVKTDIPSVDSLVDESGVPASVDLGGATTIYNAVSGDLLSPTTFSRKPVPYFLLGRSRRYFVREVVEYAKRIVEIAPRRIPPQTPRKPRAQVAALQPIKSAPQRAPVPIRAPPLAAYQQAAVEQRQLSEEEVI